MSSSKRRKQTKQKLDNIPSYTIKELEEMGEIPPNIHLKELWEYDKYRTHTSWWVRMGEKPK
jgi:hypothetical protein